MRHDRGAAPPYREVGAVLLDALRSDAVRGHSSIDLADPVVLAAVLTSASAHQVLALVRHGLANVCADPMAKPRGEKPLEPSILATVAQHLRVSAELDQLREVLDSVGAPWVVVKGPVLAELAYPEPALRPYGDLDVLVDPRAFGTAVTALENSGMVLLDQNWTLQREMRRAQASFVLPHGTALDLHWHLINDAAAREVFDWQIGPSLEQRRVVAVGGAPIPTLDAADTILHVALHGALSGGHRLLWVKDIERLARRADFDWTEVVTRAKARRLTLPVGVMLRRARRLLDADVPQAVLHDLETPRPSAFGLAAIERAATRAAIGSGMHSGRIAIATARANGRSSYRALSLELRRKLARSYGGGTAAQFNPLQHADPDPNARQRYIDLLEATC